MQVSLVMSEKPPTANQILLPLLGVIEEAGGNVTSHDAYNLLAERLEVPSDVQAQSFTIASGKKYNLWERNVRLAKQHAVFRGLMPPPEVAGKGNWQLTAEGEDKLRNARPGVVITVYQSDSCSILWAEAEAAVKTIDDNLVQAIITSPPYPLIKQKEYAGQFEENAHVDWLFKFFAEARRTLVDDGSLAINLGPAWRKGVPCQSLYAEKLLLRLCEEAGYHLAQKLYWHNPSKMPSPAEWVTVRRVRVTPSVEEIYWLSKSPHPKATNRAVLRPYSQSMTSRMARGGESTSRAKPSGHCLKEGAFAVNNGGSIPHSMLSIPHSQSQNNYFAACKKADLPVHPARFPSELAEFLVKLLSEPGDVLWDPFGGSLTTAEVGNKLGRYTISGDLSRAYLEGSCAGRILA